MRFVIQRVQNASVAIDGETVAAIARGFVVLVGIKAGDDEAIVRTMAEKLCKLRLFKDENDKMNLSAAAIGGGFLLVPNFTVYADASTGTRPSFIGAAPAAHAQRIFELFVAEMRARYTDGPVGSGVFQATMAVSLVNDGPVTVIMDSK